VQQKMPTKSNSCFIGAKMIGSQNIRSTSRLPGCIHFKFMTFGIPMQPGLAKTTFKMLKNMIQYRATGSKKKHLLFTDETK